MTALRALAAAVAFAACGKPVDHRTYVERAVALAPEIERATGLKFATPPKVEVRTADQVRAFVERQLADSIARRDVASLEAAYKRLGLVADSVDLRALLVKVLAQQVIGYYDPTSKTLFVVDGADSASADITLRHELVHALQDQHVDVDSIGRFARENDRATAAQAALEGEATYAQYTTTTGAAGGISATNGPGAWDRVRAQIRDNMERTAVLADAPFVVRESLLFPYLSGAEFARRVATRGGGDSLLRRLPASTEQVLHAEAYFGRADSVGSRPDAPTVVTLPAPTGGTVTHENTLGEFQTRLALFHHLQDLDEAARGATGWDGDRFAVVRTPQGDALVWVTVWDSPQDAAEFYDVMGQMIPHRYPDARLASAPVVAPKAAPSGSEGAAGAAGAVRQYVAGGGRGLLLRAGETQGRAVVLYVDAPPGAPLTLVDLAKVTLRE